MEETNKETLLKYTLAKLSEAPRLVKNHIEIEGRLFKQRRVYSKIKKHLDSFLLDNIGDTANRFIILPGLRGVGKTTILFQIYNYLKNEKKVEQDRILYFSTDELKSYLGNNILDVIDTFIKEIHETSIVNLDKKVYILIDEAHFDKEWSQTAKVIFDKSKNIFLMLTGSSALNFELSVDAARRSTREVVFPLNFSEYLILKYDIYPPKGTAESIRDLIFNGNSEYASSIEKGLMKSLIKLDKPVKKELEDFLCCRGFPFGLNMNPVDIHEKISNMIDRVIEKDVFSLKSFSTETKSTISRILTFLALQKPGGTSDAKLAERLKISPTLVRSILDVLEKTHLIFSVKPYGSAGKIIRKPWKYYFLSTSINAAIRFKLGTYDTKDRDMMGTLAENMVASYFFRMKETINMPLGIFYDADEEGVDFLLKDADDKIIPVEVSVGNKDKGQIKKAIKKYDSKYGIIISNRELISKEDDVIFIPITTFSFV